MVVSNNKTTADIKDLAETEFDVISIAEISLCTESSLCPD